MLLYWLAHDPDLNIGATGVAATGVAYDEGVVNGVASVLVKIGVTGPCGRDVGRLFTYKIVNKWKYRVSNMDGISFKELLWSPGNFSTSFLKKRV